MSQPAAAQSGHPAGLWVLFTTEMWERFAFYCMRAILVFYLIAEASKQGHPGFGWAEDNAYMLYGWYTSLVYISPILGGYLADTFFGQRKSVLIGAFLMMVGEFILFSTEYVRISPDVVINIQSDPLALLTFYTGLGVMILGNGFFKPCISTMVGQLYEAGDRRRDSAFTIFYMGINIGAFFSPIVAGTITEKYGFQWGFFAAGIGMLIGLLIQVVFGPIFLKKVGTLARKDENTELSEKEKQEHEQKIYEQNRPLVKQDYDRMFVAIVLSLFVIAFWLTFEQAGSSLNVFAEKNTDRIAPSAVANIMTVQAIGKQKKELESKDLLQKAEHSKELTEELQKLSAVPESQELSDEIARIVRSTKNNTAKYQSDAEKAALESKPHPTNWLFAESKGYIEKKKKAAEESVKTAAEEVRIAEKNAELAAQLAAKMKDISEKNKNEESQAALEKFQKLEAKFALELQKKRQREKEVQEFAKREYKGDWIIPAAWYQSVNAFGIVIFAPLFAMMWNFLHRRGIEPSTPTKFALGILLVSASFFIMIPGAIEAQHTGGNAAAYWLLACYLFATWGELCLSPVGLSMITKLAPARYGSLFMGIWFLASAAAYWLAGYCAAIFASENGITLFFGKENGLADFFLLLALVPMVIGFIALALAPLLKKKMHGIH